MLASMGIEYQLEPTEEQRLYHKMVDWGADIIFWRPSSLLLEPAETAKKMVTKTDYLFHGKPNQRIETMQDEEMPSGRKRSSHGCDH